MLSHQRKDGWSEMKPAPENILVIGAYGLIGHGIAQKLLAAGHRVTGLGRNLQTAQRVLPHIPWIQHDVSTLREASDWRAIWDDFSVVVNCSGALQDSPDNDLEALHHHSVAALAHACADADKSLIQISAVGADPDASTPFMATKGRGDAAIRAAGGAWRIFRPGLVLAPNAYGGTTLLRMLAAVPIAQPLATPEAKMQTVSLDYVARVVLAAVDNHIPAQTQCDLVEEEEHSLRAIVGKMRHWLGFGRARFELTLPQAGVSVIAKIADALAWLGWRSPLRSTAIKVLADGVRGAPADLTAFGLPPAPSLDQTLSGMPVGAQDRLFARMGLLVPIIIACLSLFWLVSGIIGLIRVHQAAQVLQNAGWSAGIAVAGVCFWSVVDIAIGGAFAFRKYAKHACWAAVGVSIFYLAASTITAPGLWLDPLGPLVKTLPAIILALVARSVLEER